MLDIDFLVLYLCDVIHSVNQGCNIVQKLGDRDTEIRDAEGVNH